MAPLPSPRRRHATTAAPTIAPPTRSSAPTPCGEPTRAHTRVLMAPPRLATSSRDSCAVQRSPLPLPLPTSMTATAAVKTRRSSNNNCSLQLSWELGRDADAWFACSCARSRGTRRGGREGWEVLGTTIRWKLWPVQSHRAHNSRIMNGKSHWTGQRRNLLIFKL